MICKCGSRMNTFIGFQKKRFFKCEECGRLVTWIDGEEGGWTICDTFGRKL